MERHPAKHAQHDHDALDQANEAAIRQQRRRDRALVGAWVGGTLVALVATVALLESCGNGSSSAPRRVSYESQETPAQQQAVVASSVSMAAGAGVGSATTGATSAQPDGLTVPPDVVASVSDAFVTPGQPIEVSVEGTSDITEMALSDGRGDSIPMVRDSSGLVWKVNYRVPLRPRTDRLGLSVTAKNDTHRWRRVWVFLQVDDGKQQVEATEKPAVEGDSLR